MKNAIYLFLCFIGIILSVAVSTVLFFVIKNLLALRIIILVLGLALSMFLFILSSKFRAVTTYKEEVETDVKIRKIGMVKALCPKCHKPFDGDTCFYCGFRR